MSKEVPEANPPLSPEERSAAAALTDADLRAVDAEILANCSDHWLKVARIVLNIENALSARFPGVSYIFYTQRLILLAKGGLLEAQGNLEYMRFSEVRLRPTAATQV